MHLLIFLVTLSFLGELPGQVLSFAANTIYMAITCSNHRPVAENDEEGDAKTPSKGKRKTHLMLSRINTIFCLLEQLYYYSTAASVSSSVPEFACCFGKRVNVSLSHRRLPNE